MEMKREKEESRSHSFVLSFLRSLARFSLLAAPAPDDSYHVSPSPPTR